MLRSWPQNRRMIVPGFSSSSFPDLSDYPQYHLLEFQARQNFIEDHLRFNCTCERRSLGSIPDKALRTLLDYQTVLEVRISQGLMVEASDALKLIEFYKACGLHIFLDIAYNCIAEVYFNLGITKAAEEYTRMSAEGLRWNELANVNRKLNLMP